MTRRVTLRPGMTVRYKGSDSWWVVVGTAQYPVDGLTGEERPDLGSRDDALRLLTFNNGEMRHGWTTASACDDDYFRNHYEVFG